VDYINPQWILPRWMMIGGSLLSMAAIFWLRVGFTYITRNAYGFQRFPVSRFLASSIQTRAVLSLSPGTRSPAHWLSAATREDITATIITPSTRDTR
jgi:hypothetical protein